VRELDLISRSLKNVDVTLLRKDLSLFQANLAVNAAPFLREVAARVKRERQGNLILLAILQ